MSITLADPVSGLTGGFWEEDPPMLAHSITALSGGFWRYAALVASALPLEVGRRLIAGLQAGPRIMGTLESSPRISGGLEINNV